MKGVRAAALVLCGLVGVAASELAPPIPAFASKSGGHAGSAGDDGAGDHMAPGEVENNDPVTDEGPPRDLEDSQDAERAAD